MRSIRTAAAGLILTVGLSVASIGLTGVASAASKSPSDDGSPAPDGSVVAFVKDAKAGSITVMRGEREVQITDKALARKLAKLTQL